MASLMDVTCAGDDREMMRVPDFHRALIFWPLLPQSILLSYGMCPDVWSQLSWLGVGHVNIQGSASMDDLA